jgi:hypothetical protein
MHPVIKHIIASALFISILATPKLAFDYVRSPVSLDATLAPQAVKTSVKPLSELQKIAAQVREWPSTDSSVDQKIGATASSKLSENDDEIEGDEDEMEEEKPLEIIRLDKVFFDYVMNTYVNRISFR